MAGLGGVLAKRLIADLTTAGLRIYRARPQGGQLTTAGWVSLGEPTVDFDANKMRADSHRWDSIWMYPLMVGTHRRHPTGASAADEAWDIVATIVGTILADTATIWAEPVREVVPVVFAPEVEWEKDGELVLRGQIDVRATGWETTP